MDMLSHRPSLVVVSASQEQTIAFGAICAQSLEPNDVLVLTGDLGAGKTHFTKGLAAGLGVQDPITSPTFAVMCVYPGIKLDLYHLDIYRLEDAASLDDVDVASAFEGGGVSVVEWGDKFLDDMPDDIVICSFIRQPIQDDHTTHKEPARVISCSASGPRSEQLIRSWLNTLKELCCDASEMSDCEMTKMCKACIPNQNRESVAVFDLSQLSDISAIHSCTHDQ